MEMSRRHVKLWAILGAALGLNYVLVNYPEQSISIALDTMDVVKSASDTLILTADIDNDGCITTVFGSAACASVAAYLQNRISETPLTPEQSANLPSFTGEEYQAPPFLNRI
jgi:hypothetical protein